MEDWQAYCDDKERQLSVLEGQMGTLAARMPAATPDTRLSVEQFVARWQEDLLGVRRRLAEIRQTETGDRESLRAGTDKAIANLTALVESAKASL